MLLEEKLEIIAGLWSTHHIFRHAYEVSLFQFSTTPILCIL